MVYLNIFYFVTIYVLTKIMEKREAINPRKFMIFYNFSCICLATYCFVGMAWFYYGKRNAFTCQTVDFDSKDSQWIAHVEHCLLELIPSSCIFTTFRSTGSILIPSCSYSVSRSVKSPSCMCITTAVLPLLCAYSS